MNATKFALTRDINGYNGYGLPFALDGQSTYLAANVEQHITVPSTYPNWIAVMSYSPGSNIWVDNITTAVVAPAAFAATTSELNPTARYVKKGTTLSFITSDVDSPMVGVKFYVVAPYEN